MGFKDQETISSAEVSLFLRRFGKKTDRSIGYSEFCSALLPTDPLLSSTLAVCGPTKINSFLSK